MQKTDSRYSLMRMLTFFIPLGFSASLTALTHLIINGTLSRADHAEIIIASYAIALSLFQIIERPVLVFRQTCSALVKSKASFDLITSVFIQIILFIFFICALIGYTPVGNFTFVHLFNAENEMISSITVSFRVITFVILFSGIRCLYQGVIINNLDTKWITVGVIFRLTAMFLVAFYFVQTGQINSSMVGAIIFLTGMAIECLISVWRGHKLIKSNLVEKEVEQTLVKKEIYRFYTPLVFYLSFQTVVIPVIYAFLGKIENVQLGIASFALAFSITNLVLSFFQYTHQIVLQFYKENKQGVRKCVTVLSIFPALLLAILCYTPAGIWFLTKVMGADLVLVDASLSVLQFFIIKAFLFPWVDYFGGILMLHKRTKSMIKPQIYNVIAVIVSSILLVYFAPKLNGSVGALAASFGEIIALIVVMKVVFDFNRKNRSESKEVA